ncbi:unnamed protein product [Onchocerca flexuosa]|uniref:STAS domain-containing protein n=1 Tax=Onchocerca flexuosa TaxID=387005 RepID=A0A183HHP1_9BILA|nr:unnamed protein product [Onchocerca flexuosa]
MEYILVDITRCTKEDMDLLKRVLHLVGEARLLFKAQNLAQGIVINTSAGNFFGNMDENDFLTLMRDIGLSVRRISGAVPNLASRLIDSSVPSANSIDTPSRPPQVFLHNQPHLYISSRRPLSTVPSQEIVKPSDVQQRRSTTHYQPSQPSAMQHRPITVNIVRVVPPRYCLSPLDSSSSMHVSHRCNSVITQRMTTPQNTKNIVCESLAKKESVLTHTGIQTRTIKQPLNTSNLPLSAKSNEPSTSRCGMLSESKMLNQSCKRIVHVIDDDDDEGGPVGLNFIADKRFFHFALILLQKLGKG